MVNALLLVESLPSIFGGKCAALGLPHETASKYGVTFAVHCDELLAFHQLFISDRSGWIAQAYAQSLSCH
jgi:hypothetical protein